MCLELISDRKVATEDIVCYKRLRLASTVSLNCKHGDTFTGYIGNIPFSGKISIEDTKDGDIFLCSDEPRANGCYTLNRLGYRYSWKLDNEITISTVNDEELPIAYVTPYQLAEVRIGETYKSDIVLIDNRRITVGLHSFARETSARADGRGIIVKCIIPTGSTYYEGMFNDDKSYASDTLTYVEHIQ